LSLGKVKHLLRNFNEGVKRKLQDPSHENIAPDIVENFKLINN
jgi:hypothetical protein